MRDLIKKILREQIEKFDEISVLKKYEGKNEILRDLRRKLEIGYTLTEKQIDLAIKLLKREYYHNTIYPELMDNKNFRKKIIQKGIETYRNIVRTSRKNFFKSDINTKLKVDKPSGSWIKENIDSLRTFLKHTIDSPSKFFFPNRDYKQTTHQEANQLLEQLKEEDFWGFLEKEGDDYVWSTLNKIDSNYTNWAKMIAKRDLRGDLGDGSIDQRIDNYFQQRNIEFFYPEIEEYDMEVRRKFIYTKSPTLSYAEFDLIEAFFSEEPNDKKFESKAIDSIENILDRLKSTTKAGDKAEDDFVEWLKDPKQGIKDNQIIRFNTKGNLVDVTFQIDLLVFLQNRWIPIQVKSKKNSTRLLSYDIGGLLVYPSQSSYGCGDWVYEKKNSLPSSFDKDFFGITC